MKRIITTVLLLFLGTLLTFAQGWENESSNPKYTKVYEVNKTKSTIYKALKLWLNENPGKSKNFIDVDNPDLGVLSFNMISREYQLNEFEFDKIKYKVTVEMKDEKIRVKISDFEIQKYIAGLHLNGDYTNLISDTTELKGEISSLKNDLKVTKKKREIKKIDEEIKDKEDQLNWTKFAIKDFRESVEDLSEDLKSIINDYEDF